MIETQKVMISGHTHKLPQGYKGTAISVISPGDGARMANPMLPVVFSLGYAPEGMDLVSSPSIIVGLDKKGYTVPCDGSMAPFGVMDECLRGTKSLFPEVTQEREVPEYAGVPSLMHGKVTGLEEGIATITPRIFQAQALLERGYSYKTDGASAKLFKFTVGSMIRAITKEELDTAITDDTLPILVKGETKENCPRTKGWYAGMPVVFDPENDPIVQKVGRVASLINPARYNNGIHNDGWCFDYDLQGPGTKGNSRNVWMSVGSTFDNEDYTKTIIEFWVTM